MRHPNIVQFIGVYFEEGSRIPILVMEFLPTTLARCIGTYGILPEEVSYSILHDVALGLYYLHSQTPPIVHRDLSANNVLLASNMTAKISDLGVARILNLTPQQMNRMTSTPGTPAYMPPEAMRANPRYDASIDQFSYGILMIHVLSGRWPLPLREPVCINPENRTQLLPVSEAERRNEYLRDIGNVHPLMDLILRCVSNDPEQRATAAQMVQRMQHITHHFPPAFPNRVEMLQRIRADATEKGSLREENEMFAAEYEQSRLEKEELIQQHQAEVEQIRTEMRAQNETHRAEVTAELNAQNTSTQAQLRGEIHRLEQLAQHRQEEIERFELAHSIEITETHQTNLRGSLRGTEVVAERNFAITNQAQSYSWEEYGFRLHVPEKSLEAGLSETTVNVRVSLSGHFQLSADSELVSAVYWVFSPHVFSQPITIEVQHCAAPSQSSNLSFVRTKCTQQTLPYQFKELQGGIFSQQSFYGSISVSHFSGAAITHRRSEEVSEDYCAQLYKSREGLYDCRFTFAVTKNLKACFSVVDQKYCTSQIQHYTSFTFGFEEKQISLDIPSDGIKLDNGWEIFPLCWPPRVTKDEADLFSSSNSRIPLCDLILRWTKDEKPVALKQKITIRGATKDYFTLYMAAESVPTPVSSRLPSLAKSATSQKDPVFRGSESDTPYSSSTMQSGENTLPTPSVSALLPPLPTHKHLMNEVAMSIPAKWKFMGIELGLQPHQLDAIEKEQNGVIALCFSVVFDKWKNEVTQPYSWSTVITALEAPQVGAVRLAQTLKDRLTPIL